MKGLNATVCSTMTSCKLRKKKKKSKGKKLAMAAAEEKCGKILQFSWGNGVGAIG